MKQLALVRHADADWPAGVSHDFDRALSPHGRQDADAIGRVLAKRGPQPQLIVASPARRARETATRLADALQVSTESIRYEERIYDAGTGDLLDLLQSLPDQHDVVMVVGHNPAMERTAALLTDGTAGHFRTGRAAWIALETDTWQELTCVSATLVDNIVP